MPTVTLNDITKPAGALVAPSDLGMSQDEIDRAVENTLDIPVPNPRPFERDYLSSVPIDVRSGLQPSC